MVNSNKSYRFFSSVFDIAIFFGSFFLASFIAERFFGVYKISDFRILAFSLVIIVYLFFTSRFKIKDNRYFNNDTTVVRDHIKSVALSFLIVTFIIFLMKNNLSRVFLVLFFVISMTLVVAAQPLFRIIYFRLKRKKGKTGKKYMLMVGNDFSARSLVRSFEKEIIENFEIIGFLTYRPTNKQTFMGYKVLGTVDNLESVIAENVVDKIMVLPNRNHIEEIRDIVKTCEIEGVEIFVYSDVFDLSMADMDIVKYDGKHIVKFSLSEKEPYSLMAKRFIDILGSLVILILISPILIATIIAIKIENKNKSSVFYVQDRCGVNGRKFKMFKFKSMRDGSDKLKAKLLSINEAEGPVFKMKNDPRVTKVGVFIRRYSIDELPQLYNVLIGDMSLVGPRPPIPSEVKQYDRWQRRRLSMKPGLTCIWQVSGRSNIPFEKWVKMDLEYIDNWSILLDFQLLLKTIPAVLTGKGAY
jgi:exopolysaccharide biosynthesis polyprenyl glycosylphosphotransferase